MKVAMITPRYPPKIQGGGELSCEMLVNNLNKLDVKTHVFSGSDIYPDITKKEYLNVKMYKLIKHVKHNYDIFHSYNMSLLPMLGLLTKKYNIKSIATLNGIVYSPTLGCQGSINPVIGYNINKVILIMSIKYIKKFVTLSDYYKQIWCNDGLDIDRICTIPNMYSDKFISKNILKDDGIVRLLFCGNYATWRNLDSLLHAYSLLPKKNIELLIVGSGWDNVINRYKYENKIRYLGFIPYDEVKDLYNISDIYIQPHTIFGVGRSFLDAVLNDCAVITTGLSKYYPYLTDEKDIVLVKSLTAFNLYFNLYNELLYLIENKSYRKLLCLNAKKIVKKFYNPEYITKQYIKLYEGMMNEK